MDVQIIGVKFTEKNQYGDFLWMIEDDIEKNNINTLYIYNEDIERRECKSFISSLNSGSIRCYNIHNPKYCNKPFSVGICTGTYTEGGFTSLTDDVKYSIKRDIDTIKQHIIDFNITQLYYSIDKKTQLISECDYMVNKKVINYITKLIQEISLYETLIIC